MNNKQIEARFAYSYAEMELRGCIDSMQFDSIKDAKARIKYMLSVEYQRHAEMSEPYNYARIVITSGPLYAMQSQIHSEYYRIGYNEPQSLLNDPEERLQTDIKNGRGTLGEI